MQEQRKESTEFQETPKSEFVAKLERLWEKPNFVCTGLDSDWKQIPERLRSLGRELGQFIFNREIVDATHDLVCAYKPNVAFYEDNPDAEKALEQTVEYIHDKYPHIPVIGDNKVADIGNTNLGYVKKLFDRYNFDAVTVHPYLGREALQPFLDKKDKGIFVLVKTSNPGAGEFQDLPIDQRYQSPEMDLIPPSVYRNYKGAPVWAYVAASVSKKWNYNGNCALVVGAKYPRELGEVRAIVGDMPILIPGIGFQGGEVEATVRAGMDSRGQGMIINSSRGIIFASRGEDFAQAARKAAESLREEINKYRSLDFLKDKD